MPETFTDPFVCVLVKDYGYGPASSQLDAQVQRCLNNLLAQGYEVTSMLAVSEGVLVTARKAQVV